MTRSMVTATISGQMTMDDNGTRMHEVLWLLRA